MSEYKKESAPEKTGKINMNAKKNFNVGLLWSNYLINKQKKDITDEAKHIYTIDPTPTSYVNEGQIMSPGDTGISVKNQRV